jgi:hypothetical protein
MIILVVLRILDEAGIAVLSSLEGLAKDDVFYVIKESY